MRRLLRLLAAGAIPWALAAHGAELRVGLAADVTSTDPHFLAIAPNINIAWHVFDALTRVDEDTRLIPGLALSWRAADGTTWRVEQATTASGRHRVEKGRPGSKGLCASCPRTRPDSPGSCPESSPRSSRFPPRTCRAFGATPG